MRSEPPWSRNFSIHERLWDHHRPPTNVSLGWPMGSSRSIPKKGMLTWPADQDSYYGRPVNNSLPMVCKLMETPDSLVHGFYVLIFLKKHKIVYE